MRTTCMIAEIAEAMHIAIVSRNKLAINIGVITTGSAVSAVALTISKPVAAAMTNPMTALNSAWTIMTA